MWDQKAILSLGMYSLQTLSLLHDGVILASKPYQSACILSLIRKSMPLVDDGHCCVDRGGIRGYSALLIIQQLMEVIGRLERVYAYGLSKADRPAESSFHPLNPPSPVKKTVKNGGELAKTESSLWLPCPYFDYVAGTSTGGYVSCTIDVAQPQLTPLPG